MTTREHWIQHITFAAETSVTHLQSQLGVCRQTHVWAPSTTIPSPLAK